MTCRARYAPQIVKTFGGQVSDLTNPVTGHSDWGDGNSQLTLYVDQPNPLLGPVELPAGVTITVKSYNRIGYEGGDAVWETTQAQTILYTTFGPSNTSNPDEGVLLAASAPNAERWIVSFEPFGVVGQLTFPIKWMAVIGHSATPHIMTQRLHMAATALQNGTWSIPNDQRGVQPLRFVCWSVQYAAASATGSPKFRVIWSDSLGNGFEDTGSNTYANINLSEPVGPVVGGVATQTYTFAAENYGAFDKVRLEAQESGDPANPGTLTSWISGRSNQ